MQDHAFVGHCGDATISRHSCTVLNAPSPRASKFSSTIFRLPFLPPSGIALTYAMDGQFVVTPMLEDLRRLYSLVIQENRDQVFAPVRAGMTIIFRLRSPSRLQDFVVARMTLRTSRKRILRPLLALSGLFEVCVGMSPGQTI